MNTACGESELYQSDFSMHTCVPPLSPGLHQEAREHELSSRVPMDTRESIENGTSAGIEKGRCHGGGGLGAM